MIVFGLGKSILYGPSKDSNAPINYPVSKAKMFVPIALIHGDTIKGNFLNSYTRSIICLFFRCSPSTIARLIISIAINAVKRMSWRGRVAHIGNKLLKAISPLRANCYALFNMPFISRVIRERIASSLHVSPCLVFFSFCHGGIISQSGHIFKGEVYGRR